MGQEGCSPFAILNPLFISRIVPGMDQAWSGSIEIPSHGRSLRCSDGLWGEGARMMWIRWCTVCICLFARSSVRASISVTLRAVVPSLNPTPDCSMTSVLPSPSLVYELSLLVTALTHLSVCLRVCREIFLRFTIDVFCGTMSKRVLDKMSFAS